MTILFKFDAEGGFTCGDTVTGRTAYAYPTSPYAFEAKTHADLTAAIMMANENTQSKIWRDAKGYTDKDTERLRALQS